jgi:hypothetical protein
MKDRAHWYLFTAILSFALVGLLSPAAADASAMAPAPSLLAAAGASAATASAASQGATVIDRAEAVSPDANHYKCYPILSHTQFQPRRVHLKDQFSSTWVWVWRPRYLCNPVRKTTEDGNTYPPPHPESHLVCYEIREEIPTQDWKVRTEDQFGSLELKGNTAELLCLPAAKHLIDAPGGGGSDG